MPTPLPPEVDINCVQESCTERALQTAVNHEPLTAPFTIPAIASSTTITVGVSAQYAVGMYVWIQNAGYFEIIGIPSDTSLLIQNNGTEGNLAPGVVAPIASAIVALAPPTYPIISDLLPLYDTVSEAVASPIDGNSAIVKLTNGGWAEVDMYVFIAENGWYKVTAVTSDTQITVIRADDQTINDGTTIPLGSAIYPEYPRTFLIDTEKLQWINSTNFFGDQLAGATEVPIFPGATQTMKMLAGVETGIALAVANTIVTTAIDISAAAFTNPSTPYIFLSLVDPTPGTFTGTDEVNFWADTVVYNSFNLLAEGGVVPRTIDVNWLAIGI